MTTLPDFEGFSAFALVVEERSFAGAARMLGVSVATVSRAVQRLEDRLGARLFNRSSRQLALTEYGRSLAEQAARIYADGVALEQRAREQSATPRGQIRLAVPMSFGLRHVAGLLPGFLRAYPEVSVDLHLSDARVDLVGEGYDAALRIAVLPDSALAARKLCPVAAFVVASPAYVARFGAPAHPRDLRDHPCLGYAHRARQDVWRLTNAAGEVESVTPNGRLKANNADALIPTLLDGLAIGELPEFMASEYLADGRLVTLLDGWSMPTGGLYFVTPTTRARAAKVQALGDYLAGALSRPPWRWAPPI